MGFGGLLEAMMILDGCLPSESLVSHSSGFAQPTFPCIEPGLGESLVVPPECVV